MQKHKENNTVEEVECEEIAPTTIEEEKIVEIKYHQSL